MRRRQEWMRREVGEFSPTYGEDKHGKMVNVVSTN